jgi:hypothetical protein
MESTTIAIRNSTTGRSLQTVRLESPFLAVDILLDQGGDILSLTHKATTIDVLWKVPYPVRDPGVGPTPSGDSFQQWIHYYRGGWQTIFPNYGRAVSYRGAHLDFHGEAARRPWTVESECAERNAEIEISTRLASLPFFLKRRISLSEQRAELNMIETVTNESTGPVDCVWAHHPVFGVPLLSAESRIYTGARLIHTDPSYDVPGNDLLLGEVFAWPIARSKSGAHIDLSRIAQAGSGFSRVLFLKDFREPWCALVNPAIPLGVALRWNLDLMKYLCMWQETGGEKDFPHFGRTYTTALEPSSCLFGHGLIEAIQNTHTQLTLSGGESRTFRLKAILFEDRRRVVDIGPEGELEFTS